MKKKMDLHIHSTFSDGYLEPWEIVCLAKERSVEVIALTDHDSTDGLLPIAREARDAGIALVDGVEINTFWEEEEVHILGYGIDANNRELQRNLLYLREAREQRMEKMLAKLSNLGIFISRADVMAHVKGKASIGRPHIARAMAAAGYAGDEQQAFHKYLSPGCPAFVPRYKFHPSQAISTIRRAGGLAFLAHPGLLVDDETIIEQLDLDGLEAYHSDHTPEQTKKYLKIAATRDIWISGGSDCHGQPGNVLLGSVDVCSAHLFPWVQKHWTKPIS